MYVNKKTLLLLASMIILVFSGAGVYAATTQSSTSTIYACQMKQVGLLRVVDANTACTKNETKISWNVVGPKGDKGDPGVAGPAGPQGPAGKDGAPGPQGPVGKDGVPGSQGPAGANGKDGTQGPAGTDGKDGQPGPQGQLGPMGPQGPAGKDGAVGPQGPAGPRGTSGTIVKTVSGMVFGTPSGAVINVGSGFTVERLETGKYAIIFPAGTWTHNPPVMTLTPHFGSGNKVSAYISGFSFAGTATNGSASYVIWTVMDSSTNSSGYEFVDNSFNFTAVESQ